MFSIFSCVCQPSVCLPWRSSCLVLWPIFWLGHLFFWSWAGGVACIFVIFSILFASLQSTFTTLLWILFQGDYVFPLCLSGFVSCFLAFHLCCISLSFHRPFFFLTCSTWALLFPGFKVPFDFCPWREMLVGWFVLFLVGGDLCLCSSGRRSSR